MVVNVQHQLDTAMTISVLRDTSPSQFRIVNIISIEATPGTHVKCV